MHTQMLLCATDSPAGSRSGSLTIVVDRELFTIPSMNPWSPAERTSLQELLTREGLVESSHVVIDTCRRMLESWGPADVPPVRLETTPSKDRPPRRVDCHLRRWSDMHGSPGILCLLVDVTTYHEDIGRLQRTIDDLELFFQIVSHDLREPVRMITSFMNLFMSRCAEGVSRKGAEYLAFVSDSSSRLTRMLDALMCFSRAGRTGDISGVVDLEACVDRVLANLRPKSDAISFTCTYRGLPKVLGDEHLLTQLLTHVLDNTLTHRSNDRVSVAITSEMLEDGFCRISVTDSGPGIPTKDQERVFRLFRSVSRRPSPGDGLGTGLAISRRIVERHGGRMSLTSEPASGTTVLFTLKPANASGR